MAALTAQERETIREGLRSYCAKYPSQTKAAASLKKTSAGTVSSILSGKDTLVSDDMYRHIAAQIGMMKDWQYVDTTTYKELTEVMEDAQTFKNVMWVVGNAGCGKTSTASSYSTKHSEVFMVLCSEDMKKSDFIREIARSVGIKTDGYKVREILERVMGALVTMESPLLIFDEADKLTDNVFFYFINLYNKLEDKCGIIFLSTDYIKRRMKQGLRLNKKGYNEIFSRIGRKFYELDETAPQDVYSICIANGVINEKQIACVIKDSEASDFDLRRVKRAIHREKKMATAM